MIYETMRGAGDVRGVCVQVGNLGHRCNACIDGRHCSLNMRRELCHFLHELIPLWCKYDAHGARVTDFHPLQKAIPVGSLLRR